MTLKMKINPLYAHLTYKQLIAAERNYDWLHNEGGEGYNPYRDDLWVPDEEEDVAKPGETDVAKPQSTPTPAPIPQPAPAPTPKQDKHPAQPPSKVLSTESSTRAEMEVPDSQIIVDIGPNGSIGLVNSTGVTIRLYVRQEIHSQDKQLPNISEIGPNNSYKFRNSLGIPVRLYIRQEDKK